MEEPWLALAARLLQEVPEERWVLGSLRSQFRVYISMFNYRASKVADLRAAIASDPGLKVRLVS